MVRRTDVEWYLPKGNMDASVRPRPNASTVAPRADGAATVFFHAPDPGLHFITASISFGGRQLKDWVEALVRVV
jgi:hypothetical protein